MEKNIKVEEVLWQGILAVCLTSVLMGPYIALLLGYVP